MKRPYHRLSDDDLKEFVLGFCDGKIFTNRHVRQAETVPLVFMPIALSNEDFTDIALVWEWLDAAGPRSINGYPTFISCRLMHEDDWERAWKAIKIERKRRDEIVV